MSVQTTCTWETQKAVYEVSLVFQQGEERRKNTLKCEVATLQQRYCNTIN